MKILLLGKSGQLGWELQRALAPLGETIALDRQGTSYYCGDLTQLGELARTIRALAPEVIVNAAAFTAVDKAETDKELAMLINAKAPEVLAHEAAAIGALLVSYSSDYVFDGRGGDFWRESDRAIPLNVYGESKLAGEKAIQSSPCDYLIFRTSWVFGLKGNNFVKTILRLAGEREELRLISDQVGAPTGADLLADITAHALKLALQNKKLCGLYHLAPQGETSWYHYAQFIIENARVLGRHMAVRNLSSIASADYATAAKRPANSRLNTDKLSQTFSLHLPHWQEGVIRMLSEFLDKND